MYTVVRTQLIALFMAAALAFSGGIAAAEEKTTCNTVRFGQVNWTGVSAKTETAAWLLQKLGYKTDVVTASLPVVLNALADRDRDVFMGLWLPAQRLQVESHMKEGRIDMITRNLEGAKYTLGVNQEAWDAGVRHIEDLDQHKSKFNGTILGIEAGSGGNKIIKDLIKNNAYGLGDWELMSSSEAGMLSQVERRNNRNEWSVWLAWQPHPMVLQFDLQFLDGAEDYFGPNKGGATVYTLARSGYAWECPNVAQLLENYQFTVEEQSIMADYVINEDMGYAQAGRQLINDNPELLDRWFNDGGTYQVKPVHNRDGTRAARVVIQEAVQEKVASQ